MTAAIVTLDDIRAAASRVRPLALRTPLLEIAIETRPEGLAGIPGSPGGAPSVFLKCENLQRGGAFKIRGAVNTVAQLPPPARARGVITYSSGNHGQALARAAAHVGVPAVVVMPETAPSVKVEGARRFGAEIIFAGTTLPERKARAEAEASARGLTIVPPFDHPWIIAGAGTVGLEVLDACAGAAEVYVPVGGGGLISGVAAAVKAMRPGVRVVGVEPAGAPKMSVSRAAGRPTTLDASSSIADGLLAPRPGDLTFAHVQALVDDIVLVGDDRIVAAMRWLFRDARLVAEPSGAASVAAALAAAIGGVRGVVAVVSGGNVDPADFARYVAPTGT